MALTTGSNPPSATPATDLYNLLATALTAKSWVLVETATAVQAGTTDIVKVWRDAASDCYVLIEVDNTNARLRIRCSESYNATTHKMIRPCPGNASSASQTPTANYTFTDTEQTIFQTQGASASVGWVNIPCSAGGFSYWLGATADKVLLATNSGGTPHWAYAGRLDTLISSDASTVFLAGRMASTNNDVSWTFTSGTDDGNVRTSREPLTTTSTPGAFCYEMERSWPSGATVSSLGGSPTANHKWHSVLVASPVVLHGVDNATISAARTHRATVPSWITYAAPTEPTIGDTVTIAGVVYTVLGRSMPSSASFHPALAVAVDGSIF